MWEGNRQYWMPFCSFVLLTSFIVNITSDVIILQMTHNLLNNYIFIMLINVREYWRGNHKWTIQRNWQHIGYTRGRKTKQKHNTICVGYHYRQTNTSKLIRHEPSYKQLEVNGTSYLCEIRSYKPCSNSQTCRMVYHYLTEISCLFYLQ
jgi:hypothetical protein